MAEFKADGVEYIGLNKLSSDGKFEIFLGLHDEQSAENYVGEGIWWTENGIIFFKHQDDPETSQSYEIINENMIRIKEINPSDNPILDDLIYERAPE